jgi:hypothetical protein
VREEDAGTYRCDVQDTDYRRVKRLYLGLKVGGVAFYPDLE